MRPGQWVGTTTAAGRTFNSSSCLVQADADAMNGDAESIGVYLKKVIPEEICKLSDIKVDGDQIIYTSTCQVGGSAKISTITTNYHGDSFESLDTHGVKSEAKLTGACK